ncbi:protein RodZ, contains Xre-like HTH and DUF4115 domains [Rhodospira trueperi]|uniref:Protein RodZ, contains Xre-like HTH and DUF4115 domains n=1 Tax=Rhodospira trueperi TaxID=69960 RepID=A0A1G6YQ21_9PROT|nr:protein RodZ, contains Xre-like HTH and DUF4115 domains [Rhodospira trueperi]
MANSAERRHPGDGFIPAEHVGTLLQETRLRLGQDLRIIADDLRIKYHHLLSIEDGRFDDLPGPTYVTGFIRAYAEHLGLDAEEIVRRYKNEPQGAAGTGSLDFPASSGGGGMPAGALLLILLVVVAASYGVWYWMSVSKTSLADLLPSLPPPLVAMIYGPDAAGGSDATGHDTPDVEVAADETKTGTAEDTADETPEPAPPESDAQSADGLAALSPTPATTPEAPAPEGPAPADTADTAVSAEPPGSATASDAGEATPELQPEAGTETAETAAAEPQAGTVAEAEAEADPETAAVDAPQAMAEDDAPPASDEAETASAGEGQDDEAPAPTETTAEATPDAEPESGDDAAQPAAGETDTAATATAPEEDQTASAAPAIPETSPEAETETAADAETGAEAEPEPTPEPEPQETAEAEEEPEETVPAYVGRPAPSDVQAVTGESRIVLRANRDSWIQVRRAGELVVRRLLRRGDTYAVPGGVGYTLNTSNAGGLEVYIDGRRAPNLGPVGAARNGIILSPSRLN